MAKGDERAVVGASGRPEPGMVLKSGAKEIAKKLGCYSTADRDLRTNGGHFDVDSMKDQSIGRAPAEE